MSGAKSIFAGAVLVTAFPGPAWAAGGAVPGAPLIASIAVNCCGAKWAAA